MESMLQRVLEKRDYNDFVPDSKLIVEEGCDTLLLDLQGFRKEQLRVQVTTSRTLKISGERPLDNSKWSRFQKEFPIPANCDPNEITAKFVDGTLYVKQPKMITPAKQQEKGKPTMAEAPQTGPKPVHAPLEPRDRHIIKTPEKKRSPPTTDKINLPADFDNNAKEYVKKMDQLTGEGKVDDEGKMDKGTGGYANAYGVGESSLVKYKQVISGQITELKNRKGLMNLIVAVLLGLALGLYAINSIRSYGKSKN